MTRTLGQRHVRVRDVQQPCWQHPENRARSSIPDVLRCTFVRDCAYPRRGRPIRFEASEAPLG